MNGLFGNFDPSNVLNNVTNSVGAQQQGQQRQQRQQQQQPQQQQYQPNYDNRFQPMGQSQRGFRPRASTKKEKEKKTTPAPDSKEAQIKLLEQNPNSGHYYKRLGNEYYKSNQYIKALECYDIAIKMNDTESVFFSNRARCHKMLGNIKKAYEDAVQSVELDEKNVKGHLLTGQMLAELGKMEDGTDKLQLAMKRMTKALSLCSSQGLRVFERDLQINILKAKKVLWLKEFEMKKAKMLELYKNLTNAVTNDLKSYQKDREKLQEELKMLFSDPKLSQSFDIPEYLCCKITYELMEDPVVDQAGMTYERSVLEEHIKKNGLFDPVTRAPISAECILPNLALKQAIAVFLENNTWAFEYAPGETFRDIKF